MTATNSLSATNVPGFSNTLTCSVSGTFSGGNRCSNDWEDPATTTLPKEGLDGEGGANNALGSARLRFVGTVTLLVLNRRLSEHVKRVSIARVERGEKPGFEGPSSERA